MAQLGSGQRVAGRYEILSILAAGGMAEVFLARDLEAPPASPPVVLKSILPHLAGRRGFARMFGDEARLALRLRHDNVARVENVVVHEDLPLLVMEYVEGISFLDWILGTRRQRLRLDLLCSAFRQVCLGLDYAHGLADDDGRPLGIVHRDVSPQNLLISTAGLVKIIDFGVAKAATRTDRTEAGVLKGKFPYMAPERVQGLGEDRRSDVFSVGVVAFEMTARKRLFWRESDYQTLHAIVSEAVPALGRVAPGTPPEWAAIVMRALEKRPEDRFQGAAEMAQAIDEAGERLGLVLAREPLGALARELGQGATGADRPAPRGGPSDPVSRSMTLPFFVSSDGEWRQGTGAEDGPTLEDVPSPEVLEAAMAFEPTTPGGAPAPALAPAPRPPPPQDPQPIEREDSLQPWQQRAQRRAGAPAAAPEGGAAAYRLPALPPVPALGPPPETMAGSFGYALSVLRMVRARRLAAERLESEAQTLERERGDLLEKVGARLRGMAEAIDRRVAAQLAALEGKGLPPAPAATAEELGRAASELEQLAARLPALEARAIASQPGEPREAAEAMLVFARRRQEALRLVLGGGSPSEPPERAGGSELSKLYSDLGRAAWKASLGRDRAADLFRSLDRCQAGIDACRGAARQHEKARGEFERRPVAVAVLAVTVPLLSAAVLLALLVMSGTI